MAPRRGHRVRRRRAADYNVYWGTAGKVDSVIDMTHNVPVPFDATACITAAGAS